MLRIYIIGICILLIAIVANVLVSKLDISTWYNFGPKLFSQGFLAIKEAGILNCVWLFIIYPIILACGYLIGNKLYKIIFL
ncbi:MAG: hypothetical protein VX347_02690 [Bacteroidota bacterium]|nr:hypothetical protein [Bacteroidota bacterium]